jgi:hypothetical protein
MFFEWADALGTAWEKALRMIGDFKKRLGIFIDQIFGVSKTVWIFAFRRIGAGCRIRRPKLEKYSCGENWLGWWLFTNGGIGGKNCICFVYF